jgi:hypothetical protein
MIIMPHSQPCSSLQLTGQADFWHPTGLKADGQGPVPFCRDRCQAAGQRLSRAGNAGMPAQLTDRNGRSWTMCLLPTGQKARPIYVQMVISGQRITTILLVQVLEFGVREIDTSCARSVARFGR